MPKRKGQHFEDDSGNRAFNLGGAMVPEERRLPVAHVEGLIARLATPRRRFAHHWTPGRWQADSELMLQHVERMEHGPGPSAGEEMTMQALEESRARARAGGPVVVKECVDRLSAPRPRAAGIVTGTSGENIVAATRAICRPVDHDHLAWLAKPAKRGASCGAWGIRRRHRSRPQHAAPLYCAPPPTYSGPGFADSPTPADESPNSFATGATDDFSPAPLVPPPPQEALAEAKPSTASTCVPSTRGSCRDGRLADSRLGEGFGASPPLPEVPSPPLESYASDSVPPDSARPDSGALSPDTEYAQRDPGPQQQQQPLPELGSSSHCSAGAGGSPLPDIGTPGGRASPGDRNSPGSRGSPTGTGSLGGRVTPDDGASALSLGGGQRSGIDRWGS